MGTMPATVVRFSTRTSSTCSMHIVCRGGRRWGGVTKHNAWADWLYTCSRVKLSSRSMYSVAESWKTTRDILQYTHKLQNTCPPSNFFFPLLSYHVQLCTVPLQSFQSWCSWIKLPPYVLSVWRREKDKRRNYIMYSQMLKRIIFQLIQTARRQMNTFSISSGDHVEGCLLYILYDTHLQKWHYHFRFCASTAPQKQSWKAELLEWLNKAPEDRCKAP